jgi:HEAT repeat protein
MKSRTKQGDFGLQAPRWSAAPLQEDLSLADRILRGSLVQRIAAIKEAARDDAGHAMGALLEALLECERNSRDRPHQEMMGEIYSALSAMTYTREQLGQVAHMLKSGERACRIAAATILSGWKDPEALPDMIHALGCPEPEVVECMASAIGEIARRGHDCSSAREPLLKCLGRIGRTNVRNEIKGALEAMGVKVSGIMDYQDMSDGIERTAELLRIHGVQIRAEAKAELVKAGLPADEGHIAIITSLMWVHRMGASDAVQKYLDESAGN